MLTREQILESLHDEQFRLAKLLIDYLTLDPNASVLTICNNRDLLQFCAGRANGMLFSFADDEREEIRKGSIDAVVEKLKDFEGYKKLSERESQHLFRLLDQLEW